MKLLITGRPRSGKTTLCRRVVEALASKLKIGGVITEEVRRGGVRTGFKIMDLMTGREMVLASVDLEQGPRVGKYRVSIEALEELGEKALVRAMQQCDLIVIDEVGYMELKSRRFIEAVAKAFNSEKHVMATVPLKSGHTVIRELKRREDIVLIEMIDPWNRDNLFDKVLKRFDRNEG